MSSGWRGWPFRAAIGLIACTAAFVAYRGFLVTPYDLRIVRGEIPIRTLADGPVRILMISDVDYPHYASNLERVAREGRAFDPDFVLVAGDFLDQDRTARDPEVLRAAATWFDRLPAPGRRLLAPGEEESPVADALAASWPRETIEPLVNEHRRFVVRGQRIDLFVADPRMDPGPWRVDRENGRPVLQAAARGTETWLRYAKGDAWADVEATLAFRPTRRDQRILMGFAADPAADPRSGRAWVVFRDEDHSGFRARAQDGRRRALEGRTFSGFVPPVGVWTRCRLRLTDDGGAARLRARFWAEGAEEPRYWTIDAKDRGADRIRSGTLALGAERGLLQFADLRVEDPSGHRLLVESFDDPERFRRDWTQFSRLGAWLASETGGATRVVLAHSPDIVRDIVALGGRVDLVLSGHTHGGQVRLPWIGPLTTGTKLGRGYDRGLFEVDGIPVFVTAGIGTSVVPFRLGAPPDCALLTLVPASGRSIGGGPVAAPY